MQMKVLLYGDAGSFFFFLLHLLRDQAHTRSFFSHHSLAETDASPEAIAQLSQEAYNHDVLLLLVERIGGFEFEVRRFSLQSAYESTPADALPCFPQAKKDVTQIFNHLLRRQIGSRFPTVEYIAKKPQIVFATLKGCVSSASLGRVRLIEHLLILILFVTLYCRYSNEDVALNTGMILKEMLRSESLAKILLYSEQSVARFLLA